MAIFAPIQKDTKKIAQIMLEIFLFAALAFIPTGFAACKSSFCIRGGLFANPYETLVAGAAFMATRIGMK